jgi:hypothetical protein
MGVKMITRRQLLIAALLCFALAGALLWGMLR